MGKYKKNEGTSGACTLGRIKPLKERINFSLLRALCHAHSLSGCLGVLGCGVFFVVHFSFLSVALAEFAAAVLLVVELVFAQELVSPFLQSPLSPVLCPELCVGY